MYAEWKANHFQLIVCFLVIFQGQNTGNEATSSTHLTAIFSSTVTSSLSSAIVTPTPHFIQGSCLRLNLNYSGCCVSSHCSNKGCYCDQVCYIFIDCCYDIGDIGCHPSYPTVSPTPTNTLDISDKNEASIAILGTIIAVAIIILAIICVLFCLYMRRHPPRGKNEEGTSPVYDVPDIKSNLPSDTSNIEMLSYKEHFIKEPTGKESLIYDLPAATPTTDDAIRVQDNAAYTVFKK